MRTQEIQGPEQKSIGENGVMDILPSGQMRIRSDIAIANHIMQFWNPPGFLVEQMEEAERKWAAEEKIEKEITEATGMAYMEFLELPWAQQDLLLELHKAGNDETARMIASDLTVIEHEPLLHQLMVKATALRMYLNQPRGSDWDYARTGVSEQELAPILKQIVKTNANWPKDTNKWQRKLRQELRGLKREKVNWGAGFGVDCRESYWDIKKSAKK